MPTPAIRLKLLLLTATALTAPALGQELPTGASVQSGSVGIATPGPGAMIINQSSQKAIVNWQSFSIGQGGIVDIAQPNVEAALLNRVTGAANTTIAGSLSANGQVFIVNPNGIAITGSGTVNAGGFVASTLGISDADFKAGNYEFTGDGSSAAVSNAGKIDIASGGYAALIGGRVDNAAVISAPLGRIGLGAGELATLDLTGDGFLQVALPSDGSDDGALVTNSGTISADGGRIEITAAAAQDAARNVINLSGVTQARTVSGRSGAIVLGGGGGGVKVTGNLDVSAPAPPKTAPVPKTRPAALGGSVIITGTGIELAGATVNASGADGGGSVKIGGDFAGAGILPHARTVSIDAPTLITADATVAGDGGEIALWSDYGTRFAGTITARGAGKTGSGGYVEVSSPKGLSYTGVTDLRAPSGNYGTLLLDPYNVIITSGSSSTTSLAIAPTHDDFVIDAADLMEQLESANVTIATGGAGSPGTQAGNITVDASLAWGAPTALTLDAFGDIFLNSDITTSGGLVLTAGGNIVFEGSEGMFVTVGALGLEAVAGGTVELNEDTFISSDGDVLLSMNDPFVTPSTALIAASGDVVIDTSQFINNVGPGFIDAEGRTLIYSTNWEDDVRGGLTGSNLYGRTYEGNPPGTIPGSGNVFLYSDQPVLTVFIENGTRVYRNPGSLTADVSYDGLVNGDTLADAVTGSITDTTAATAGVGLYAGALTAAGLTSPIGYLFSVEGGDLTITPAPLTITASDLAKLFGQTLVFEGTEFTVAGLYSGDTVDSVMLASLGAAAGATIEGGPYAITASDASGTGLGNYTITYQLGSLTVVPGDTGPSGGVLIGDGPTIVNPPDTLPASFAPEPSEDDLRLSLEVLKERTEDFRQRLAVCERDVAESEEAAGLFISCVSEALEEYATDLEDPLIRLPPELQAVSNVMRQTVQRLRAAASAPTPQAAVAEARAAIGNLVDFVRQQTELVSAVDPETEALLVEHGNVIAGAVEEMDLALVGAVEI